MRQITADSIALLRSLVAVPSQSFFEDKAADFLFDKLSLWGLSPKRLKNNIYVPNDGYDASKPTLVLDAHIDTVPPSPSYTRDPYESGEDPEMIFGLGANDDGGSVVSMIAVCRHFYKEKMPINLVLTLSAEEERSGSDGFSLLLSENGPSEVRDAKWAIMGEPTGMKAATGERGLLVLDCTAEGVSGHAANGGGVNALYKAIDDIEKLRHFKFDRISPVMGEVRLNVTQINAGAAHNVIPDKCSFVVDVRPTEQYSNAEIFEMLQKECGSTLKARNLANRASVTPAGSALVRTLEKKGIECFSSPTTSNWVRAGKIEAIKMGPGESVRSHKADEYILASEIGDAVEKYIDFVQGFYGDIME